MNVSHLRAVVFATVAAFFLLYSAAQANRAQNGVDAADDRIEEMDQKFDDLESKIEELKDKLEELELQLAARR